MKATGFNSWRSWGIAVSCCVVTLLIFVPGRLAGLLYISFMERYNVDREHASYPIFICLSLRCYVGPFVAYLGDVFECRTVILSGCILGSVGFGACFFAEDIQFIYISMGVVYAVGLSLANTLVPMLLKLHFNKHLTKANGLTMIGYCGSVFFMCPVYEYFVREYGVNGAFLLTSGIMIHSIPAAIFLKNPHYKPKLTNDIPFPIKECHQDGTEAAVKKTELLDFVEVELHNDTNASNVANEVISQPRLQVTVQLKTEDVNRTRSSSKDMNKGRVCDCLTKAKESSLDTQKYSLSAEYTRKYSSQSSNENSLEFLTVSSIYHQCKNSEVDLSKTDISVKGLNRQETAWTSLYVLIDPSFIIILFAQAFNGCTIVAVWTIMVDMARDKNISHDQQIYLLQFLPVAEFVGYVCLGWVTDGGHLSYANFCCSSLVCLALICVFLVWSYNFTTMMTGILLFGLTSSAMTSAFPTLIYKYIDEKKQPMAIASRFIGFATLNFSLAPMIGYFREYLGAYDWILYIMGATCLLGSIMVVFLPKTASFTAKKQQKFVMKEKVEIFS